MNVAGFVLLILLTLVLAFMVYRLWFLYFDLLEYHQRFLEKTDAVLRETNKYLEIPLFEFTPEVRSWVTLVRDYRNVLQDSLKGFEVVVEIEEKEKTLEE